ncbi:visual pigment-like receptor peropsin [Engraulis encrasicolus]|uniref:visual pigment-like receptor peropsin n=1 Tax=Engraulis encrasicolus TaxID=184585 RepID=UPI002FD39A8E
MNSTTNSTAVLPESGLWTKEERYVLVAVLSIEMVLGILGNSLVLVVKIVCKYHFQCKYWLPMVSLTLSDLSCSVLIISGSLLAMLTGGQRSPWCEVVSMFKFTFMTSSIGSISILCVQKLTGIQSTGSCLSVIMALACLASWLFGVVFGIVPVIYDWIKYDSAEMLCAVFWENSYSDMLVYILCAFSVCIFLPFLLMLLCSILSCARCGRHSSSSDDLSSVTPLLVSFYLLCYTPFAVSELILLGRLDLSPSPEWLRTFSSVVAYLDCGLNPILYCTNQDFRQALLALLWTSRKLSLPEPEPELTRITRLHM